MADESGEEKERGLISTGFCYSDFSSNNTTIPHLVNQMQSYEANPDLFNLQTGIEMLGFPSKELQERDRVSSIAWKGFSSTKPANQNSSSSKTMADTRSDFYQPDFHKPEFSGGFTETSNQNLIIAPESSWQENNRLMVDDSSLRCVFPCEGNERPSQGLSLSLCTDKPSNIGLQSFELRQTNQHHNDLRYVSANSRDVFFGKAANLEEATSFSSSSSAFYQLPHHQLKNSKYLVPAQELLNEFCNLGTSQTRGGSKHKFSKTNQWEEGGSSSSSSLHQSLLSLDLLELQKRKAKLLSMLEEVDRRYRVYCGQMRAVVSSFEAVAGNGAATVYSSLASKAMSRHFRCLRDGIVGQIQATKRAMEEKDPVAPGTTRGETPRLKLLDQTLRQQKAFQQMSMMENHPWRPQRGLPERSVSVLRAWLFEHFLHPYPSDVDKHILARQTGLSRSQVSNWFINARVRLWKPMVEEMYVEETKEQDNIASDGFTTSIEDNGPQNPQNSNQNPNSQPCSEDQKPKPAHLAHDPDSLSSIINKQEKMDSKNGKTNHYHHQQHHHFDRTGTLGGAIDLDFSSYNNGCAHPSFSGGNSNGVSLTLGLQQHGSVSLSFSPAAQHSLFFSREHMEECQPLQYSLLDGEAQALPYRNLMGAQLLHDLAG
eukprot:TRINITY_DN6052_c4_g1_i1.p1 TRINITY_DN6052_c4_g1~~TRINITY_DN6052_c4_g1_i1.p1  ORF type:complete len:655 (+),score=76.12 TRINITY_DN6052_c4_g1_i1:642-2606(+)